MTEAVLNALAASQLPRLESKQGFDAIVVGAGASGGLAALELTTAGLSVLVLDAGWRPGFLKAPLRTGIAALVKGVADPRLRSVLPPSLIQFGQRALRLLGRAHQPVQSRCFAWPLAPEAFVCDRDRPYANEPGSQFDWFRTEQIGGRMIVPGHGRQYYRLAEQDFHPEDGLSPSWPLRPDELTPWYEKVEVLLGLSGGGEACPYLPSGRMNVVAPTAAEAQAITRIRDRWANAQPILGRSAPPLASIDAAAGTGRLFLRQGAVVSAVLRDGSGRVHGVEWHDRETRSVRSARAPLVFLCASTLESTRILLSSQGGEGPPGAGSGVLGRFLMDHVILSAEGVAGGLPGEPVADEAGRCVYVPRFDLRSGSGRSAGRGYGVQIYRSSIGAGKSYVNCVSFAEMAPRADNRVVLDPERRDAFGLPTLRIACRHSEFERALGEDQAAALGELGELFEVDFRRKSFAPATPGTAIHECGAARMGDDPATSVVDPDNQCWEAPGLYVTDGACFPSQGAQNPTLTIMALTARACAHALGGGGAGVEGRRADGAYALAETPSTGTRES